MPRFSANIDLLFTERPFNDRFAAAAEAGFQAVEFYYPYGHDHRRLADRLAENGLALTLINSPKGNPELGEKGFACIPGKKGEFQESITAAIDSAVALGCPCVQVMAGRTPEREDFHTVYATYLENLRFAAAAFAERGIKALIEATNPFDNPGYFLDRPDTALRVLEDAGVANLFLLFDVYHAQVTQGNLARTIEAAFPSIAHIQIADNPGRHEPGTGEINYPFLFRLIDGLGYDGWIGCEYHPKMGTTEGLHWARPDKKSTRGENQ